MTKDQFSPWNGGLRGLVAIMMFIPAGCDRPEAIPSPPVMSEPLNLPPDITALVFRQWRDARRGTKPAEKLTNPYWAWLIQSEASSWAANEHFKGPSSFRSQPAWSAERFGQSATKLSDGRTILVAGEHEDYYDPDFFIYNDVIIIGGDGGIEILGYPESVFPPTDFHSATEVGGKLVLIGNLGYREQRDPKKTPILVLDLATWEIREQASSGENPGWIHRHEVMADGGSITVRGGEIWTGDEIGLEDNFDDWRLNLDAWTWERLTRRKVTVLEMRREDGERNQLFEMGMWKMRQDVPALQSMDPFEGLELDPESRAEMEKSLTGVVPRDRLAFERRYQPDGVTFQPLPEEDSFGRHLIEVEGVRVHYAESFDGVRLTIEDELGADTVTKLRDDLKGKLERAEGARYQVIQLRP